MPPTITTTDYHTADHAGGVDRPDLPPNNHLHLSSKTVANNVSNILNKLHLG